MNARTALSIALVHMLILVGGAAFAADRGNESTTRLTSAQEVADSPVESEGVARATIAFDAGLTYAKVNLVFSRIEGEVTRLHLHCNVAGANGPVAIGLIDSIAPVLDNSDVIAFEGQHIFGILTNEQFPLADDCLATIGRPINNIASLAAAIDAGYVYWNLHTDAYPAGEVRGQVRPLD